MVTKYRFTLGISLIIVGSVAIFSLLWITLYPLLNSLLPNGWKVIQTGIMSVISTFSILFYSKWIKRRFL